MCFFQFVCVNVHIHEKRDAHSYACMETYALYATHTHVDIHIHMIIYIYMYMYRYDYIYTGVCTVMECRSLQCKVWLWFIMLCFVFFVFFYAYMSRMYVIYVLLGCNVCNVCNIMQRNVTECHVMSCMLTDSYFEHPLFQNFET